MAQIKRYLHLDLTSGHSHFLWGARKTGKTTFLKKMLPDATLVDLLKYDEFENLSRDPTLLRKQVLTFSDERKKQLIILDEIQKIPPLLDEVHWMIENLKPIRFILSGSSSRKLKRVGANLLGGRAIRHHMLPLCYPELKSLDWKKIINSGLIPSHYMSDMPNQELASYVHDYILPEVHSEANLRTQQFFHRFLEVLIFSQGEILNYNAISRDCGVSAKTAKIYFEILSDMYLGYFLFPYFRTQKREAIRETPKFYLMDTGLSSYLRRTQFQEFRGEHDGRSFEHFVFLELKAFQIYHHIRDEICFWRTRNGSHEVDFVWGQHAIETKMTTDPSKHDFKGLLAFREEGPCSLHLVCRVSKKRLQKIEDVEILIWPVEDFLIALWEGKIVS